MKNQNLVNIKNLKVFFKSKRNIIQAVRGIDFAINNGEIIGIVGESGSGKSVLVKSIIGFNENSRTTADKMELFDEKNNLSHKLLTYKRKNWPLIRGKLISYIPQNPLSSLNPTMKIGKQIYEAVEEAIKFKRYEENRQSVKEIAVEILSYTGIHDPIKVLKSYPHELSGGMRQRVVIAITLVMKPKLIIADEPTTALDVSVQAKIIDIIKKINKTLGIAIIFISHDISLIANFTDKVYVVYAGKIMEKGLTEEVFGDPRHPYTWALLSAIPDKKIKGKIEPIPGTPPNMIDPPIGDPFAVRNKYAMEIDFKKEPPLFQITKDHFAASWLVHPKSPKVVLDQILIDKLNFIRQSFNKSNALVESTLKTTVVNKLPTSFDGINLKTFKPIELNIVKTNKKTNLTPKKVVQETPKKPLVKVVSKTTKKGSKDAK